MARGLNGKPGRRVDRKNVEDIDRQIPGEGLTQQAQWVKVAAVGELAAEKKQVDLEVWKSRCLMSTGVLCHRRRQAHDGAPQPMAGFAVRESPVHGMGLQCQIRGGACTPMFEPVDTIR
jgi:hypothetical protein